MNPLSFITRRLVFVLLALLMLTLPLFAFKFLPGLSSPDLFTLADESRVIEVVQPIRYFENDNSFEMNPFELKNGLFSFEYRHHLEVKMNHNVYYLEDLKNKRVVFQIFELSQGLSFDENLFECARYIGDQTSFFNKTVCFTKFPPENFVINVELFGSSHRFFQRSLQFFATKKLINPIDFDSFSFFSRAEAVQFVLTLRYPNKDFSEYAQNCFSDIDKKDPLAGTICFAKKESILVGMGGHFYPEQSINLYGLLKILFLSFDIKDYDFNEHFLDESLFEQMQTIHIAYPLIAKAYYEGIFTNITDQIHWANRHVYRGEAIEIIHRFMQWKEGRRFKSYDSRPAFNADSILYLKGDDFSAQFEEEPDEAFDEDDEIATVKYRQYGLDTEIYFLDRGAIYRHLYTLKNTPMSRIKSVFASFNAQRLKGKLIVLFQNGDKKSFKLKQKQIDFQSLKSEFLKNGHVDTINALDSAGLLPNVAKPPLVDTVPSIDIYLDEPDFENIFIHRTGNNRYRAWLDIKYPDGTVLSRSILIKTRGNANRGYIKSGFTIEALSDLKENKSYEGDEFFKKSDEFKLRGFINEETMLHEKLFYSTFEGLGHQAPDFFDATVTINGVPIGFYQVTEAIKESFFDRRDITANDYYYARNSDSDYNTNLGYYDSDEITLSQYKYQANPDRLLDLIKRIEANDATLMGELNVQNIFDYAMSVFLFQSNDALTHNFYVYYDEKTKQWNIFPWDADECLNATGPFNIWEFLKFVQKNEGTFNQLIYYLFNHLSFEEVQDYMKGYLENWNQNIDLQSFIQSYMDENQSYYIYDNQLWNGRFLERKNYQYNTLEALEQLKELVGSMQVLDEQGIGLK